MGSQLWTSEAKFRSFKAGRLPRLDALGVSPPLQTWEKMMVMTCFLWGGFFLFKKMMVIVMMMMFDVWGFVEFQACVEL